MAIAWSTAALLIGLLPGFAFLGALAAGEPYSRDNTPKSPFGQLALIVLISAVTHGLLTLILRWIPAVPDVSLAYVLRALLVTGAVEAAEIGTHISDHLVWIGIYLVLSVLGAGLLGWFAPRMALRISSLAPLVAEHSWIYDVLRSNARSTLAVFVLTRSASEGEHLLYQGTLQKFGLKADGRFAYVVIAGAVRSTLNVRTGATSKPPIPIGAELLAPKWLYLDGDEILNVFFGALGVRNSPGGSVEETLKSIRSKDSTPAAT